MGVKTKIMYKDAYRHGCRRRHLCPIPLKPTSRFPPPGTCSTANEKWCSRSRKWVRFRNYAVARESAAASRVDERRVWFCGTAQGTGPRNRPIPARSSQLIEQSSHRMIRSVPCVSSKCWHMGALIMRRGKVYAGKDISSSGAAVTSKRNRQYVRTFDCSGSNNSRLQSLQAGIFLPAAAVETASAEGHVGDR
jgi:hypothetical protein